MKWVVSCETCCVTGVAECPNQDDADRVAHRHYALAGHEATITQVLDTPLEGLL